MSSDESFEVSLEDINESLTEIDIEYSPEKTKKKKDEFEETLEALSTEFDSIGLPLLDFTKDPQNIFKQVVFNARSLVHIYRSSLSKMKDVNIDNRSKDLKSSELYKVIEDYKSKIRGSDEKNKLLHSKIFKLTAQNEELTKKMVLLKDEVDKIKRYHNSKRNELLCQVTSLKNDNNRLKQILEKESVLSKDEATMKILTKYRNNEEILKSTVKNLQENNRELLDEIFNLKEEQAMNCASKCT